MFQKRIATLNLLNQFFFIMITVIKIFAEVETRSHFTKYVFMIYSTYNNRGGERIRTDGANPFA